MGRGKNYTRVRGGSGLGDSIYVRAVVEYLLRRGGRDIVVCSDYPGVFLDLPVTTQPFSRADIQVLAHYTIRKSSPGTTQWEDVCACARVPPMPFRINWPRKETDLIREVESLSRGRPIVLVHAGKTPMGRSDGFGAELLPSRESFEWSSDWAFDSDFYTVRIGSRSDSVHPFPTHLDLRDRTSISDLFDLTSISDGVIAQCSLAVPLAESQAKPLLAVWSSKGVISAPNFVRSITPQKVLSSPSSRYFFDLWPEAKRRAPAEEFRAEVFRERDRRIAECALSAS